MWLNNILFEIYFFFWIALAHDMFLEQDLCLLITLKNTKSIMKYFTLYHSNQPVFKFKWVWVKKKGVECQVILSWCQNMCCVRFIIIEMSRNLGNSFFHICRIGVKFGYWESSSEKIYKIFVLNFWEIILIKAFG